MKPRNQTTLPRWSLLAAKILLILFGIAVNGSVYGDIVLHDTYSNSSWYDTGVGQANYLNDAGPSALNRVTMIKFLGDGNSLFEVGTIWQYGNSNGPNLGDPTKFNWRAVFYENVGDFTVQGLASGVGPNAPTFSIDLTPNQLANFSTYLNVVSTSGGVNNHQAVVNFHDLGFTNILTIAGQEHLFSLIPFDFNSVANAQGAIARSNYVYSGGLDTLYHTVSLPNPVNLNTVSPYTQAAGYVKSISVVPEPSSGLLLALFAGVFALRRIRNQGSF